MSQENKLESQVSRTLMQEANQRRNVSNAKAQRVQVRHLVVVPGMASVRRAHSASSDV